MATLAPSASTLSAASAVPVVPAASAVPAVPAVQIPEHLVQERAQQIAAQNQGFRITAKGNALCLYCSCFMRRDRACTSKTHRVLSEQQARTQLEQERAERAERAERSIGRRIGRVLRSLGSRNAARVAVASITALGGAGAMLAPHLQHAAQITASMAGLR